jgi:hypothetical protein
MLSGGSLLLAVEAARDMIVRRLLAGVAFAGLLVPGAALASAPHLPWQHPAQSVPAQLPADNGARVFARADGIGAAPAASPAPAASRKPAAAKPKPAASAPPAAPTPPPTAEQAAKARAEFDDFAAGRIDRTHYSGFANSQITDGIVSQVGGVLKSLGAVKSFVPLPTSSYQGVTVYNFVVTCANGSMDELIAWDDAGKIQLIYFRKSPI